MEPDLWELYRQMLRSRLFEELVKLLWDEGRISGEMHMSIGEEGITAGVVAQLLDGDALALDHRPTAAMIMRGVDPLAIMRELLGDDQGLCRGWGGHMHLYDKEHLAASSGIVGSSAPTAAGFALAAQLLRPTSVAVAFFGEGAMNQGMLMESMNLAVSWKLPVLFVCKDNQWAIATVTDAVTGGYIENRARSFGMPAASVDGRDAEMVWRAAAELIAAARSGSGPAFLHATCVRPDGHMLGDMVLKTARRERIPELSSLLRSAAGKGDSLRGRLKSVGTIVTLLRKADEDHTIVEDDPLQLAREKLNTNQPRLFTLEEEVMREMETVISQCFLNQELEANQG